MARLGSGGPGFVPVLLAEDRPTPAEPVGRMEIAFGPAVVYAACTLIFVAAGVLTALLPPSAGGKASGPPRRPHIRPDRRRRRPDMKSHRPLILLCLAGLAMTGCGSRCIPCSI